MGIPARAERKRRPRRGVVAALAGVVVLGAAVWLPWARELHYDIALAHPQDEARARDIIAQLEKERIGGVVPRVHLVWFPRERLVRELADALPQYATVTVERVGIRGVAIRGALREPFARWCRAGAEEASSATSTELTLLENPLAVVDCPALVGQEEGRVYRLPYAPATPLPDRLWVAVGAETLPSYALPPEEFARLRAVVRWLEAQGLTVAQVEAASRWVGVRLKDGGAIFLGHDTPWEEMPAAIEALAREGVLVREREGGAPPLAEALREVRYIDLRYFPRVYVGQVKEDR